MMASDLQQTARIFKAFADPTRLRLLVLLERETLCVMDLVTILALPQPAVSRHLGYLQRAGLVTARKKGLWRFYRLASKTPLLNPLKTLLKNSSGSALQRDQKHAAILRRKGGCCPK